jgi:DNA helicase II / ATP-dependent DNA helicase PcrA
MPTVADLHIHSHYSLATSPKLLPTYLDRWARIKGIDLVGTGDCTHPKWLSELEESLESAGEGLFKLKDEQRRQFDSGEALAEALPEPGPGLEGSEAGDTAPRFVLTGEICTIYRAGGKTRKVHHLVLLPSFESAWAFQSRLEKLGNISSDGRPILGIGSRDLFGLLLDADPRSILVPAHIWTPWFSALGARSGFDSIDECYGDLAPRIGAIETGLSSNPPMNWALSSLDRFAIISNSDAHSPEKLCREATVIDMEMSFAGLSDALSGPGAAKGDGGRPRGEILETIEFFPQEGKYHYDGHRACGVVLDPEESAAAGGVCPVCGKELTPGVLRRVRELADRPVDEEAPCPPDAGGSNRRPYRSLIPAKELVSELLESGESSKKVIAAYNALVAKAGSELGLLTRLSLPEIEGLRVPSLSGELLAEAIGRMRSGKVSIKPGYDGEYGVIRAFAPGERFASRDETALFDAGPGAAAVAKPEKAKRARKGAEANAKAASKVAAAATGPADRETGPRDFKLEPEQERAVAHSGGPALVIAGPGTGKTAVLALRVERLVAGEPGKPGLDPAAVLALTFTNKAAGELRFRLGRTLGEEAAAAISASTFHSFCRSLLSDNAALAGLSGGFKTLGEEERYAILEPIAGSLAKAKRLGAYVEARKRFLLRPGDERPPLGPGAPPGLIELTEELGLPARDAEMEAQYSAYRDALKRESALDFADLVAGAVRLLSSRSAVLEACRARYRALFVDEYQDVDFAQYALVRLLAPGEDSELFVIGDPNQAIYGFRGADKRFIDRFIVDYPKANIYRLTRSFRCAPSIIDAASGIVGAEGLEGMGTAVSLARSEYPTDKSEAEAIAREIDRLIGGTRFFARDSGVAEGQEGELASLADCAVLARAAALLEPIEKALLDHGIPFYVVGEDPEAPFEIREERVSLMTIHAAKGLEFDYVFVPGLEEGILPFTLFDKAEGGEGRIEEERRILYVAMTRARIGLRLSWARSRVFKGRSLELPPSSFLSRLEELVPLVHEEGRRPRDPQLGLF